MCYTFVHLGLRICTNASVSRSGEDAMGMKTAPTRRRQPSIFIHILLFEALRLPEDACRGVVGLSLPGFSRP